MRKLKLMKEGKNYKQVLIKCHLKARLQCSAVQWDLSYGVLVVETVAWVGPRR